MESNYKNSYKVEEKELVSLSVYNVGFEKCDSLHQWGPGIRDHYLIHYVISGKGSYIVKGKTFSIKKGDVFLIYPDTEITYIADKEDPWEYAWVGFTGADGSIILRTTDFETDHPLIENINFGKELLDELNRIYEFRGNGFEHALLMTGHLYSLLSLFVKYSTRAEENSPINIYVQKAIEYISANYSYQVTIEDLAAYVGVSRSYLFKAFKSVLSTSPKEYLTSFRIKQACNLLDHSKLSITAIANSVGFDNSLYFSKAFRKNTSMSPSQYKKKAKKNKKTV